MFVIFFLATWRLNPACLDRISFAPQKVLKEMILFWVTRVGLQVLMLRKHLSFLCLKRSVLAPFSLKSTS